MKKVYTGTKKGLKEIYKPNSFSDFLSKMKELQMDNIKPKASIDKILSVLNKDAEEIYKNACESNYDIETLLICKENISNRIFVLEKQLKSKFENDLLIIEKINELVDMLRMLEKNIDQSIEVTLIKQNTPIKKTKQNYTKDFSSVLICEENIRIKLLSRLHEMIDGKKGKYVAEIIRSAVEQGYILKPTFRQVRDEFGDIGAESGYNKAYTGNFTDNQNPTKYLSMKIL